MNSINNNLSFRSNVKYQDCDTGKTIEVSKNEFCTFLRTYEWDQDKIISILDEISNTEEVLPLGELRRKVSKIYVETYGSSTTFTAKDSKGEEEIYIPIHPFCQGIADKTRCEKEKVIALLHRIERKENLNIIEVHSILLTSIATEQARNNLHPLLKLMPLLF